MTLRINKLLTGLAMCACCSFTAPTAWGNITVRLEPASQSVGLGDMFEINIVADILDPILGWGLDLNIADPSVISVVGAPTIGPSWFSVFTPDGDGLAGIAFPTGVSGMNVLLATVTFTADALGWTDVSLGVTINDYTEGFPLDNQGFDIFTLRPAHVSVVPVPAGVLLGLVGLGLAGVWRKMRR